MKSFVVNVSPCFFLQVPRRRIVIRERNISIKNMVHDSRGGSVDATQHLSFCILVLVLGNLVVILSNLLGGILIIFECNRIWIFKFFQFENLNSVDTMTLR